MASVVNRIKKTTLERRVEWDQGRPIAQLIVELTNQQWNDKEIATKLQISNSMIGFLRLKYGIRIQRVALLPNQRVQIVTEERQ